MKIGQHWIPWDLGIQAETDEIIYKQNKIIWITVFLTKVMKNQYA